MGVDVTTIIPEGAPPEIARRFVPCATFRMPRLKNPVLRFPVLSVYSQYFMPHSVFSLSFDIVQIESAFALPLSKMHRIAHREDLVFDMHSVAALDLQPYIPSPLKLP